mgnify:CR=1 FL=1
MTYDKELLFFNKFIERNKKPIMDKNSIIKYYAETNEERDTLSHILDLADYVSGNGTKEHPYKIEKENGYFGSYVKLDDKLWRIYQVNEKEVKLVLK